jgi:nucleotide-binding universal stress UspA family protein
MNLDEAPSEVSPAPALRVVVGYEGSAGSQAALERAVDVAGDDGVVFVVHAYALPAQLAGTPQLPGTAQRRARRRRVDDQGPVGADGRTARSRRLGVRDHRRRAAEAIADVAPARHTEEIVVGSRMFGLARVLLGSVARDLIRLADVGVTVIPRGLAARPAAEAA